MRSNYLFMMAMINSATDKKNYRGFKWSLFCCFGKKKLKNLIILFHDLPQINYHKSISKLVLTHICYVFSLSS